MPRPREHIHCLHPLHLIPPPDQLLQVPGQGSRVAGHVHHPPRRHGGDGLHHREVQPLPGRVHGDDVGPQPLLGQLGGKLGGVPQEKLRVVNAVAPGVGPGVRHRLRHDFAPHHPPRFFRHYQGNGARATIQVQGQLLARQPCPLHRQGVQLLRLGVVHLIEGRRRQPKREPAQGVLQIVLPPQRPIVLPQNHVGPLPVD